MMTHERAYELLADLVALRVVRHDEAELRAHVASCDACASRLAELERAARGLRAARAARERAPQALASLEQRVLAIPASYPRRPASRLRRRLVPAGIGIAAAAAVAALVLVVLRPGPTAPAGGFQAVEQLAVVPVDNAVSGTVAVGAVTGPTRLIRLDLRGLPLDGSGSFDLWLLGSAGAMRAGTFGPDADGDCVVDLAVPSEEQWNALAITRAGAGPHRQVVARA